MTMLDDFFAETTESLDPRLRAWKTLLDEPGTSATMEVVRSDTGLGQSQSDMDLLLTKNGIKQQFLDSFSWDDDLNSGFIKLGVRAVSVQNEAERFALGLRAAMRKPQRDVGDGYFNAVLVDLLKDSDLIRYPAIAEVLDHATPNPPHREHRPLDRYTICRGLIAEAISERARELTKSLGYTQEEAKEILVAALARYLDERFTVSSRRRLGLL